MENQGRKGIGGHQRGHRGKTDEWLTPKIWIDRLGPFDLDPCASIVRPWPTAAQHYTIEDDGLTKPWPSSSFVFMNPPYGPETYKWLKLLADQGNGIALIFARTETEMFFESVWKRATALLFLRGRLHFCNTKGEAAKANAGAPSVFVAYGQVAARRLEKWAKYGQLVTLRE